jgi:adenylate cyclase class 2
MGLRPSFVYEKFRAEWTDGKGQLVLDETPLGNIAEIEGAPTWIDATARNLGVTENQYVTSTYAEMFFAWKRKTKSTARQMTFKALGVLP